MTVVRDNTSAAAHASIGVRAPSKSSPAATTFVLGNLVATPAPNLGVLMLARVTSAVAAGVFEVMATAAAAALAPERQRGRRAIALVVAGFRLRWWSGGQTEP